NNNTLLRIVDFLGGVSVSLPKHCEVQTGTHCWRIRLQNNDALIGWTIIGVACSKKRFLNGTRDKRLCMYLYFVFCILYFVIYFVILCFINGEWNDSNFIASTSKKWEWGKETDVTIDMYLDTKQNQLKWKHVIDSGKGYEYNLKDCTTFLQYPQLSLVPHIWLHSTINTCVQIMKIDPNWFGLQYLRTNRIFLPIS
ncbi:hypothetical protein RFI_01559, partial [Reticulomyxa filosa]